MRLAASFHGVLGSVTEVVADLQNRLELHTKCAKKHSHSPQGQYLRLDLISTKIRLDRLGSQLVLGLHGQHLQQYVRSQFVEFTSVVDDLNRAVRSHSGLLVSKLAGKDVLTKCNRLRRHVHLHTKRLHGLGDLDVEQAYVELIKFLHASSTKGSGVAAEMVKEFNDQTTTVGRTSHMLKLNKEATEILLCGHVELPADYYKIRNVFNH